MSEETTVLNALEVLLGVECPRLEDYRYHKGWRDICSKCALGAWCDDEEVCMVDLISTDNLVKPLRNDEPGVPIESNIWPHKEKVSGYEGE